METLYDFVSVALFMAAAGLFFYRFQREDPPLAPYVVISVACAGANWLGNSGAGAAAIGVLIAAAACTLHLALQPLREDSDHPSGK